MRLLEVLDARKAFVSCFYRAFAGVRCAEKKYSRYLPLSGFVVYDLDLGEISP